MPVAARRRPPTAPRAPSFPICPTISAPPSNAIIGFTTLAISNIDDKNRVKDYLSKTLASSNHLLSLINDVLDMSRIESGKIHLEEVEVNLSDVLHDLKTNRQRADLRKAAGVLHGCNGCDRRGRLL